MSTSIDFTWNVANPAPDAVNDSYSTGEDDVAVLGGALSNDSDPDGDSLSAIVQSNVTGSHGGLFSIASDGTVSFDPNGEFQSLKPGESVVTSFTYQISDGEGGTDTATVSVTVNGANDAPVTLAAIATQSSNDHDPISLDTASHFSDPDHDTLTYSASNLPTGLSIDPNTGIISGTIDHSASVTGPYHVTVIASDGDLSTSIDFTWNVANPAPDAVNDSFTAGENDFAVIGNAITNNDSDPDGDTLSATPQSGVAGSNGGLFTIDAAGNVSFNANGAFEALNTGETATTHFSYQITDSQGGTDTATVAVTVSGVNDAPIDGDEVNTVTEDTTLSVADGAIGDLLNNATDVEGNSLTITGFTIAGVGGTQSIGSPVAISEVGSLTIHSNGSYSFTPVSNYTGSIPLITYTVSDGHGGSDTSMLTLSITPVQDLPHAVNDTVSTQEDTAIAIAVRANDSDPDGDFLSVTAVSQGTHGSVAIDPISGNPVYTPSANFHGSDSFTYTISDGHGGSDTATVTVTVNSVNDAPLANDDSALTTKDTPLTLHLSDIVTPNDTDIDGDSLVISGVSNSTHGTAVLNGNGSVTFTPEASFHGLATFNYTISDGHGGTDTATVSVTVLAPPVVAIETVSSTISVASGTGINTSFEADGNLSPTSSYAFVSESRITAWETTASDGKIEVWDNGFGGRPAYEGNFFIELNANQVSTLWQAVNTTGQNTLLIDFQHGQRSSEQEQIRLLVGTVAPPDKASAGSIENLLALGFQEVLVTNTANLTGWSGYQGLVSIPDGQSITYVAFQSIPFPGGNSTYGNFLDAINLVGTTTVTMADSKLSLSDVDSTSLTSATIKLTNAEAGDLLAPDLTHVPTGVTYHITHTAGAITVEFTGAATLAEYESLLDSVGFVSSSSVSHDRILEVTITDNTGLQSNLGTTHISFLGTAVHPVVIDLDGDGVEFVSRDHGIEIDVNGDGIAEHTAWAHPDDAVLVYDHDQNGLVTNTDEFAFKGYVDGAHTDLEGLRHFDSDGDGLLTAHDHDWSLFFGWQDANGNGVVDHGEMIGLHQLGIDSISLNGVPPFQWTRVA